MVKEKNPLPLCKCRVLYLGSSVPTESSFGAEAVQKPLRERYNPAVENVGIDSRLIVYSNGIQIQYVDDPHTLIWFPISVLRVCAAVKCTSAVNGAKGVVEHRFLPIDELRSNVSSNFPAMVGMITRRTSGVKILECHCFITKTDEAAMAVVTCCSQAYDSIGESAVSDGSGGTKTSKDVDTQENNFQKWMKDHEGIADSGGYFLCGGEKYTKNFDLWSRGHINSNIGTMPRAHTLGTSAGHGFGPHYAEITDHLPANAIALDRIPPAGTLPPGARLLLAPAALVYGRGNIWGASATMDRRFSERGRSGYRSYYPESHVDSVSQQGTLTKTKPRKYKKNETRSNQKKSIFQSKSFEVDRESRYHSRRYSHRSSSKGRHSKSLERHRRSPSPRRHSHRHKRGRSKRRSKSTSPTRERAAAVENYRNEHRVRTPSPDYDDFEKYWHGYNRSAATDGNIGDNRRLSQQYLDSTIDHAVQKEFVLRDGEKSVNVTKDGNTKVFKGAGSFAQSMQVTSNFGSSVSAYDLVANPKLAPDYDDTVTDLAPDYDIDSFSSSQREAVEGDHIVPFSDLEKNLGYIP